MKVLQTPSVNSIIPFDPLYEYTINFTYTDNQSVKNRAIITDNSTSTVVYDKTQTTMRLQHIIPENTLVAGKQYLIQIQVYDVDGNSSNLSTPVLFYCYSTPLFNFQDLGTDTHRNASITLQLNYSQTEDEKIKSFQFFQYSYERILLNSSSMLYSSSDMSYSFYGLDNNMTYYFRAIGETNHGIVLDTGYVQVDVAFDTIPTNIAFQVENHYNQGYVSLQLNIKDIGYEVESEDYEIKDGLLILKNNSLNYNEGFSVEDNFSLFIEAKELPIKTFLTTNDNTFSLSIMEVFDVYYCKLSVAGSSFAQYIPLPSMEENNGHIKMSNNSIIGFEVKRINGYYNLDVYYKS